MQLKWKMRLLILIIMATLLMNEGIYGANLSPSVSLANSQIVSSSQEIFSNGNQNDMIVYSTNPFLQYKGTWYDFGSFADISTLGGGFNITYMKNNSVVLQPYVMYLGTKQNVAVLNPITQIQIGLVTETTKGRNAFKFGNNFTAIAGITEFGFDIKTPRKVTTSGNKTIIDGLVMIDYSDLIRNNYTLFVNDTMVRITGLRNGFNNLDPFIRFNSSGNAKDGYVFGEYQGVGNGNGVVDSGDTSLIGYKSTPPEFEGDPIIYEEYRSFFSFNTTLPANSVIKSANISVKRNGYLNECNLPYPFTTNVYIGNDTIGAVLDTTDYSDYLAMTYLEGFQYSSNTYHTTNITNPKKVNITGFTDFEYTSGSLGYLCGDTLIQTLNYDEVVQGEADDVGSVPNLNITYYEKHIYDTENITWFYANFSTANTGVNAFVSPTLSTNYTMNGSSNGANFLSRVSIGNSIFHSKDYIAFPNLTMWDYNITTNTTITFFCNSTANIGQVKNIISANLSLFNVSGNNIFGIAKTSSGNSRVCPIGALSGNETIQINSVGLIVPYNYRLVSAFNFTSPRFASGSIEWGTSPSRSNISLIIKALNGFSNITIYNKTSRNINTNTTSLFETNISCANGRCGDLLVELFYNTTSNANLQIVNYTSPINFTFLQNKEGLYCGNMSDVLNSVENKTCSLAWNLTAKFKGNYSILANVTWLNSTDDSNLNNTLISNVLYVLDKPTDTCTYSSGNWNINCNDNCTISIDTNLLGNKWILNGMGNVVVTSKVKGFSELRTENKCNLTIKGGGLIG